MYLNGIHVRELTTDHVARLITDQIEEHRQLDYKYALPGSSEEDRREFAKDVVAMANTSGGILLYGIQELEKNGAKTGIPSAVVATGERSNDEIVRRLTSMIQSNTDPPLTSCEVQVVPTTPGPVIAVGIPKSVLAPHGVKVGGAPQYWRRADRQNYPVSTNELRGLFLERDQWDREIEEFRRLRIDRAREARTVRGTAFTAAAFMHVLPLGRLRESVPLLPHTARLATVEVPGLGHTHDSRPNLDGWLRWSNRPGEDTAYIQWFRCGGVELGTKKCHYLNRQDGWNALSSGFGLHAIRFARSSVSVMTETLGIEYPLVILLSVTDMHGGEIRVEPGHDLGPYYDPPRFKFDDSEILLPPILLPDGQTDVKSAVTDSLDVLWQAAGFPKCHLRQLSGFGQF